MTQPEKKKAIVPMAELKNPHLAFLFFKVVGKRAWQKVELLFEHGQLCNCRKKVRIKRSVLKFMPLKPLSFKK